MPAVRKADKKASAPLFGGITLEAALAVPLALFFILTFFSLFGIIGTQIKVQQIMERNMDTVVLLQASKAADALHLSELEETVDLAVLEAGIRLGVSEIENVSALTLLNSDLDTESGVLKLVVTYAVQIKTALFPLPTVRMTQVSARRLWTGKAASDTDSSSSQIVYVAEHGTVYHLTKECRHLIQKTETVTWEELQEARSENGAIYYACSYCKPEEGASMYFITSYGNRYHSTLSCSELKITVRAVAIDEVGDLPCCLTCRASS